MANKPLTRDEIEYEEKLNAALAQWHKGVREKGIKGLDEAHERIFGHSFDLEKEMQKAQETPSNDKPSRNSGNDERD